MANSAAPTGSEVPLQLIITAFERTRNSADLDVGPFEPTPLTAALQELSIALQDTIVSTLESELQTTAAQLSLKFGVIAYTAHILQLSTVLHPLPSPSKISALSPQKIRHHPYILTLEAVHNLELVLDIYPVHNFPPAHTNGEITSLPHPRRAIGLALFDMDSTLINEETIDELASTIGPEAVAHVSAITHRAMNGELDFTASLRERVAMLKGVRADIWKDLAVQGKITVTPGTKELIQSLKRRGAKTAVVSGGFQPMVDWLVEELGLDWGKGNHVRDDISIYITPSVFTSPQNTTLFMLQPCCLLFQGCCKIDRRFAHLEVSHVAALSDTSIASA